MKELKMNSYAAALKLSRGSNIKDGCRIYINVSSKYLVCTLLSDSGSRVRMTIFWFFFCNFANFMCTIQEQSRGKSFLEGFLVMQILVSCIDSSDSILLFYAKFTFI